MSFSSPSSLACSCAPMKYCGLRNEMQPARHDMALLSAAEVCPAITEQHLSCCEILFYCFISKPALAPWLFYKAGIYYICLLQAVLSIYLWASCTWLDPQGSFYMDHCYFCGGLPLLIIFPGDQEHQGFWQGRLTCHCSPRIPVTFTTQARWHG